MLGRVEVEARDRRVGERLLGQLVIVQVVHGLAPLAVERGFITRTRSCGSCARSRRRRRQPVRRKRRWSQAREAGWRAWKASRPLPAGAAQSRLAAKPRAPWPRWRAARRPWG